MYPQTYIYSEYTVNAIVRLPHPRSRDSQGQETFLAPSADKQTRNYDTECSNDHPSLYQSHISIYLSIYLSVYQSILYIYIYIYIYILNVNTKVSYNPRNMRNFNQKVKMFITMQRHNFIKTILQYILKNPQK